MAKKQDVEQKDSQAEDIDLNLDDIETDDFIQEAKDKAETSRESESEDGTVTEEQNSSEEGEMSQKEETEETQSDKENSAKEQETSEEKQEQTKDEEEITISKQEWEDLKNESQKNLDGWQRALADYHNLQKQAREERERLVSEANENLMRSLMPLLDNFNLALQHLPEDLEGNNWVEGVTYINKQMMEILQDEGLHVVEPEKGTELDPVRHEAVQESDSSEDEKEKDSNETPKIQKVVQPGYVFHDKVLKPAKVVAK